MTLEYLISQKEFDMIMFNTGVSVSDDHLQLLLQAASIGVVSAQSVFEAFLKQETADLTDKKS